MIKESIFMLMGGLGFFFFGMQTMSEGLKKVAGNKLKNFLHNVTKNPLIGILVGTGVTCMIQSSSATTVMIVGFVNAGLLTLKQSIPVIMGANIGTTFTAWLVSSMSVFKITKYALPAIGIGYAFMSLAKSKKKRSIGQVVLGFGLLFVGLGFMKDAFDPLSQSQMVIDLFATFSQNPLLACLIGTIFTVLLQSSSATIAIVQILALNGIVTFEAAIPLMLGGNLGTTITAQLAAIGTNLNARRTAMSHTIFNLLGVLYMLILVSLGVFSKLIGWIMPGEIEATNIMIYIAVAHSAFNILNTVVFLPFTGLLEKASVWLVPKKDDTIDFGTQYLEKHLLETPGLAIEQIVNENIYMLNIARKATTHAVNCLITNDLSKIDKVSELETITDNLQSEITQYIVELSERDLLPEEAKELPVLIHNVNDLERIGDHAQNLSELIRRKHDDKLPFTDLAMGEIKLMWEQVELMMDEAEKALKENDVTTAKNMLERESKINYLHDQYKISHIDRLSDKKCDLNAGFIFVEVIDNLEKIGDRLINIGQSVLGRMQWEVVTKDIDDN